MIKILKDGEKPIPKNVIFKTTCKVCGCEFEFETGDCKYIDRTIRGHLTVECPCCHEDITKSSFLFEYRLVECE